MEGSFMPEQIQTNEPQLYRTITGGRISLSGLSDTEYCFLDMVAKKYDARKEWTRFAAWWNAKFNASGLTTVSVVYRICEDLEVRLGINQGKVSSPDYRDYLSELIGAQFGSRKEFCRAAGVDPGQLSRVLANRDNLSVKVLLQVMNVLHAHLVIQTEEDARAYTSVEQAAEALRVGLEARTSGVSVPETSAATPPVSPVETSDVENATTIFSEWKNYFPNVDDLDNVIDRARFFADRAMPMMINDAA
jgi:transcriptional regulator with XRE-family HTH domain